MDSHWYSNSAASRQLTAPLVRQKVKNLLGNLPLILLGDFNANEFSSEIQDLEGQNDPSGSQLIDTYRQIHPTPNSAIDGTTLVRTITMNGLVEGMVVDDNTALGIDGATNTDGLDVTSAQLGTAFPEGFLIVMDDNNPSLGRDKFKLVPWESIASIIPGTLRGDMNGDGVVNNADINLFVQALTDRAAYDEAFPIFNASFLGDLNEDGSFNLGDVSAFRIAVNSGASSASSASSAASASSAPEPSALLLLIAGGCVPLRFRFG